MSRIVFFALQRYVKDTSSDHVRYKDAQRNKMQVVRELFEPDERYTLNAWNEEYYQEHFFKDSKIRSTRYNIREAAEIAKKKVRLKQLQERFEQRKKELKEEEKSQI